MVSFASKHFGRWVAGLLIAAGAVTAGCAFASGRLRLDEIAGAIAGYNPLVVFGLMAALPLAGFSISIVDLVAGVRFGPYLGLAAVTGATVIHLVASYWIGRSYVREPLQRWLARRHHHLPHVPPGENGAIAAMVALVPGLPYFARNYLLALTDVPLRLYFSVCLPLYVVRSGAAILLGNLGTGVGRHALVILALVYALKLSICAALIWRIRRRLRLRHEAAQALEQNAADPRRPEA